MKYTIENILLTLGLIICNSLCNGQKEREEYHLAQIMPSHISAMCWFDGDYLSTSCTDRCCTKETMTARLDYHHVRKRNLVSAIITHSGFSRFGELSARLGYGRTFGNRFSVALQGVYLLSHAEHYAAVHSFTINLSAFCQMSDKCALAIEIENPIRMRHGVSGGELIPMQFDLHLLYWPYPTVTAYLYAHKTLPGALDIGAGVIAQCHPHLLLDFCASNTQLAVGIHIPWHKIIPAIRCQWHYRTGFSPQCSLALML